MLLAYRALSSYCRGPVLLALNLPSLLIAFPIFGSLRLLPWRSCLFLPMCVLPHDILLCVLYILLDNSCLYYIILWDAFQVILLYLFFQPGYAGGAPWWTRRAPPLPGTCVTTVSGLELGLRSYDSHPRTQMIQICARGIFRKKTSIPHHNDWTGGHPQLRYYLEKAERPTNCSRSIQCVQSARVLREER